MSAWRVDLGSAMEVTSFAPPWLAAHPPEKSLGRVELSRPRELVADASLAESMLRALYRGEQPRLASQDVSISLSAVSFRPLYDSYARCVAQLVPASFKQLERSTIAFAPGRATLNDTAKARLDLIAEYVKADRTVVAHFRRGLHRQFRARTKEPDSVRATRQSGHELSHRGGLRLGIDRLSLPRLALSDRVEPDRGGAGAEQTHHRASRARSGEAGEALNDQSSSSSICGNSGNPLSEPAPSRPTFE